MPDRVGARSYALAMSHDAWADESFAESDREGVYVVSAAVFGGELDDARSAMLALRGRRFGKLHWSQMESDERRKAADVVAGLGGLHIVKGETEPLLWVADIVAGACRAHRLGVERYGREVLGEVVYDIEIESGC